MWLATGAGFGFSPIAPGTVGAVWGIPLAFAIAALPAVAGLPAAVVQLVVLVGLILIGVPICRAGEQYLGVKDPKPVVYDEIATVALTFYLVPAGTLANPLVVLAGFALHRAFDIAKPPPVRQAERLPGGLGIMTDDVLAGLYALGSLHLLLFSGILPIN